MKALQSHPKKTILIFLCIITVMLSDAQSHINDNIWYNNGALVTCQPGCLVTVQGDMTNNGQPDLSVTHLTNNGFLWIQGNVYGDDQFQQRGTGTARIMNKTSLYTAPYAGSYQLISGGYRVRGGQAAIGVDDGSFYNLEIANDQGLVFIKTNNADVRNAIDFSPLATTQDGNAIDASFSANRILTYDPGTGTTPAAAPANGNSYTTVFGMMNTTDTLTNYLHVSSNLQANTNATDNAYIQGKHRRAVSSSGGLYSFPIGLEPSTSITAARGVQYNKIKFQSGNNYDVITGYFQQGLSNAATVGLTACSGLVNCTYGTPHGAWNFSSTGTTGLYDMTIYPQDFTNTCSMWGIHMVTKNSAFDGSGCGSNPITGAGLVRMGMSGFTGGTGGGADFDWATNNSVLLGVNLVGFSASLNNCKSVLQWQSAAENGDNVYTVQYSNDGVHFTDIASVSGTVSNSNYGYAYSAPQGKAFYRLKMTDNSGWVKYSSIAAQTINCGATTTTYVYPNPANDQISVHLNNILSTNGIIYNAAGQQMWKGQLVKGNNNIRVRGFANGTYSLVISNGNSFETEKIIISH